jgi:crossover junction endodeoxyribonuclease RuvC
MNKGCILGIDLSLTSTGICLLGEDNEFEASLIKTKSRGYERLIFIKDEVESFVNWGDPRLVVLEGYSFGSKFGRRESIGELGGIIKLSLVTMGRKTIIAPPTCLKKFVTGKGNSGKEIMLMRTLAKYKIEFNDNNLCDAFGLAKMGQVYLEGTNIKYEQEALEKVSLLV